MIPDGFSITRRPRILIEGLQSFTPRHGWHRHSHSVGNCRFHLHGAGHRGGFGEKMRTTRRRKPMRKSANWKRTCAPRKERGLQSARPFPNRRNPLLRLFHKTPRPRPRHSPHGNETGADPAAHRLDRVSRLASLSEIYPRRREAGRCPRRNFMIPNHSDGIRKAWPRSLRRPAAAAPPSPPGSPVPVPVSGPGNPGFPHGDRVCHARRRIS